MIEEFLIKLYDRVCRGLGYERKRTKKIRYVLPFDPYPQGVFVVSTTTRCNFNCPHCAHSFFIDKNKSIIKDISISVFETLLMEGRKANFKIISFSGGEPILHPRFKELVGLVAKYDYLFNFVTNAWLHKEYWPIVNQNRKNLELIFISLDGATAEVHDAVRNKPGSFERVIEAIKFFGKNNIPMVVTSVFTQKNYHQVEEIMNLCVKLGVRRIKLAGVLAPQNSPPFSLTDREKFELVQKIENLSEKFRDIIFVEVTLGTFQMGNFANFMPELKRSPHFCKGLSGNTLYVDHDGGIIPCCDIYRECKKKPLIQEKGFEECYRINLDVINEIKKRRLHDLLNNPSETYTTCDYCNKYTEIYFNIIAKQKNQKNNF